MNLQDQLEIGRQAEEFIRYLEDHPYFEGLIARIRLEYESRILELYYEQTDEFKKLMLERDAILGLMDIVKGDIQAGAMAFEELNGIKRPGGIL